MSRDPSASARYPRTGPSRSLLASLTVHLAVLGSAALFGVLGAGGAPSTVRAYQARFERPREVELARAAPELLELPPPTDLSEPVLRESEVWAEPGASADLLGPSPEPGPAPRSADWIVAAPFEIGALGPGPASEPFVASNSAPAAWAAPPARLVADPVPLEVPTPPYPRLSRRAGEEGSVLCRLELDLEGRVVTVEVVESSGFERLDRAACETLAEWRFVPRLEDGRAAPSRVLHRVTFRLSQS